MAQPRIQTFNTNFIAFFRPIKRTYYILQWHEEFHFWGKHNELHPLITLHKTMNHGEGSCVIHVQKGRRDIYLITVKGDGHFLKIGNLTIPIMQKIHGYVSNGCIGREYIAQDYSLNTQEEPYLQDIPLWAFAQPPLEQFHTPITHLKETPIPRRIATLIAEEAIKNNESCPITMEPIILNESAVTSCYHVFSAKALESWIVLGNPCPVCRNDCVMTKLCI